MSASLIHEHSILSKELRAHVYLLPMLNRFGIKPGLGDKTVVEVCHEKSIDTEFFLHIANSYIDPSYLKKVRLSPVYPPMLASYLRRTNDFYLHAQLPNIQVHLEPFIKYSGKNPSLQLLKRFLDEFKDELYKRINYDNEVLLPYFIELSEKLGPDINGITLEKFEGDTEEDKCEELIGDIQGVMIKHLSGDFNDNLCYAVLFSLSMIEKDLSCNNRLRMRIFFPMLKAMEGELGLSAKPIKPRE